ncbi:hypothetical protein E4T56_gene13527 [Termitomyces sp. T112]|nr:hypothetical protein E4T56_gene13527 [Termitomyces sp. T112]
MAQKKELSTRKDQRYCTLSPGFYQCIRIDVFFLEMALTALITKLRRRRLSNPQTYDCKAGPYGAHIS